MDWDFTVRHLISGAIPVTAALALYYLILRVLRIKQNSGHIAVSIVFCLYLTVVLTVTGLCLSGPFSPRIVYLTFADMFRGPVDTALNMLLFIPMGVFLPLLYDKYDRLRRVAAAGFLISLSVEIAQMFGGTTDINDLITNTLGSCIGYGLYSLIQKALPVSRIKRIQVKGVQVRFEFPLFWVGALLIMKTAQLWIFHVLF